MMFKIRFKSERYEIEVEAADREFVESHFMALREKAEAGNETRADERLVLSAHDSERKPLALVEFVRSVSPKTGTQYFIAIGHWLEKYGGRTDGFKTRDIADGFQEVKFRHSNPSEIVRQARSQGLLMDGREPNSLVLTSTAESWISTQLSE
jgi:hypothetical protein